MLTLAKIDSNRRLASAISIFSVFTRTVDHIGGIFMTSISDSETDILDADLKREIIIIIVFHFLNQSQIFQF